MLTTRNLPYIPASITYNRPIGQARYGQSAPACLRKGFAIIQQARHSYQPNQVHFRLGLQVHFQLLPTPPCGDAVTFSCAPGLVRKRPDFHGLISCFRNRTAPPLQGDIIAPPAPSLPLSCSSLYSTAQSLPLAPSPSLLYDYPHADYPYSYRHILYPS